MTTWTWRCVESVAQFLERDEREAVLGDLCEGGAAAHRNLFGVLGLVVRRHLAPWRDWRPWLAAFGLALPGSLCLMGLSLAVSKSFLSVLTPAFARAGVSPSPGLLLFFSELLLLLGWSWTGGYVLGSLSRRTIWISGALSLLPCLFCLARFHAESLSRFCLLLFLLPAAWGLRRGLRLPSIRLRSALLLAVGVTLLTLPSWHLYGPWIPNWALSWPAWYIVLTAWRSRHALQNA